MTTLVDINKVTSTGKDKTIKVFWQHNVIKIKL